MEIGDELPLVKPFLINHKYRPNILEVGQKVKIISIIAPDNRFVETKVEFEVLDEPHKGKRFVTPLLSAPF
jgi:hypothetical protein